MTTLRRWHDTNKDLYTDINIKSVKMKQRMIVQFAKICLAMVDSKSWASNDVFPKKSATKQTGHSQPHKTEQKHTGRKRI